jgi:nitrite reductase/ring-hydroxylating ferredoxin subunit
VRCSTVYQQIPERRRRDSVWWVQVQLPKYVARIASIIDRHPEISMPRQVRVAAASDVPPGTAKEVMADDQVVALFNVEGTFYALDGVCPHAGGPLGEGTLRGSVVTCPWHGWQFDVKTGENCLNRKMTHKSFAVKIEGNDVLVELP